jgi:hypothetical protein
MQFPRPNIFPDFWPEKREPFEEGAGEIVAFRGRKKESLVWKHGRKE